MTFSNNGEFEVKLLRKPKKNHRKMITLNEESYEDPYGFKWIVPAGTEVNGLSLPQYRKNQPLWKNILFTIGRMPIFLFNWTPWTSNARIASIFHDYECDIRKNPADRVHRMFYCAMLDLGTPEWQAKLFYESVKLFEKW